MTGMTVAARILIPVLLSCFAAMPAAGRQSEYWPEVEKIDAALRQQKWKPARKQARKLAATVVKHSWHDIELEEVLAELAFQQAAALANLGEKEAAIWYWHIAQNLDFRIVRKDLAPYGVAGKLLREFRLRSPGKVPGGFRTYPRDGKDRPPGLPKLPAPRILTNTGATTERPGDFAVELVIDQQGKTHHPVVISASLHPIVIYFVLAQMLDFPPFEPARYDGEPVDCLYDLTVRFHISRWASPGSR